MSKLVDEYQDLAEELLKCVMVGHKEDKDATLSEVENEKYPQIVLETDGTYVIYIDKDVKVSFKSPEAIEEFCKNKNFKIIGKKAPRYKELPYYG